MMGPAVLVVEDVPQIRATAVQMFQELGCEVFDAYNGYDALKILEAHPEIKVLFADVCMPGMRGPDSPKWRDGCGPISGSFSPQGMLAKSMCSTTLLSCRSLGAPGILSA